MIDRLLTQGAREMGIELSDNQVEQFSTFARLLVEWNDKFNLTSITDPAGIVVKHYLDSLTCLVATEFPKEALVADVGTGAGFPGVPLAIVRPDLRLTLIEATKKKLAFLEKVVAELSSRSPLGIELVHARAEEVGRLPSHRERYDVVVARAVAEMRVLAEYCIPLVKVSGMFIAMKGPEIDAELAAAGPGIGTLGGGKPRIAHMKLPIGGDRRSLIIIKKVKPTPEQFPRHGSRIARKPAASGGV